MRALRVIAERLRSGPAVVRIGEGILIAVVAGLVLAAMGVGPGEDPPRRAGGSSESADDTGVPAPEARGDGPATLAQLAVEGPRVVPGTVDGRPVPPSPRYDLSGGQCPGSSTDYTARLADGRTRVDLVAAVADRSPDGTRVQVDLVGDDRLLDRAIVDHRTSGTALSAALDDVDVLSVRMTSLTRTDECTLPEIEVFLMDGVIT